MRKGKEKLHGQKGEISIYANKLSYSLAVHGYLLVLKNVFNYEFL